MPTVYYTDYTEKIKYKLSGYNMYAQFCIPDFMNFGFATSHGPCISFLYLCKDKKYIGMMTTITKTDSTQ